MNGRDIKTLITSGTVIIAVGLYLLFGNKPPTEEEYAKQQAEQQTAQQSEEAASSETSISLQAAEEATGNTAQAVKYLSANDGDTFTVELDGQKQRVRLLMLDTPEMNYDKGKPMPYAEEAKQYTIELLENAQEIQLLFDRGPETDKYDRLLAYVFVDGVLLQEAILSEGYGAIRYVNPPNDTLEDELRAIQKEAEQQKKNIWSHEGYFENNRFNAETVQ